MSNQTNHAEPMDSTPKAVAIYGQTTEVVYKRETSNGLEIKATVCHYREFSSVMVRVTDEDSYVNAINMHIWGIDHKHYSDLLAQNYLESSDLQSICVHFDDLCIPLEDTEADEDDLIVEFGGGHRP